MSAGGKLALTKEPVVAVAFAAMLLAFSHDKLDQSTLAQEKPLALLCLLLQVRVASSLFFWFNELCHSACMPTLFSADPHS
jgi:hypothetical protein